MNLIRGMLALSLLGMVACATPPGSPPLVVACDTNMANDRPGPALVGVAYGAQATAVPINSVQFSDWNTAGQVAIQQIYGERTATGTVQVTARLTSCVDVGKSLLMRTSFFDTGLAPTEQPSGWKRVYLPPRASAVYSEFSTSLEASNYLIEINAG